ncbi:MAG: hypothetical protein R2851_19870 [Caldilineaceae bacterium]
MGAAGADPSEPADPWREPAGTVSFAYTGRELALQLAPGAYWGYLFVTVDGAPANVAGHHRQRGQSRRPGRLHYVVRARRDHRRRPLGRRAAQRCGPARRRQSTPGARRDLAQLGTDAAAGRGHRSLPPAAPPAWPGVLLLVSGLLCVLAAWAWRPMSQAVRPTALAQLANVAGAKYAGDWARRLALGGGALTVLGALLGLWWLTLAGVGLLALAGLLRPVLWLRRSWPRCLSTSASPCRCCPSATFPSSTWACWAASACSWSTGCSFRDRRRVAASRRWRLPPSSWPAGRW